MFTLEFKKHDVEVEIKHAKEINSLVREELILLFKDMETFNSNVPLASIKVEGDIGSEYEYGFIAKDGRTWSQVLNMSDPKDPAMTFDVPDGWKLSEFEFHRNIRLRIIAIINEFEMKEFTVTFLA